MTKKTKYESSYVRLKKMPEWFYSNMVSRYLGIDEATSRVYLSRWKKEGLIESFGEKSKVYFNLNNLTEPLDMVKVKAISTMFPEAIVTGDTILHLNGNITQIPGIVDLEVLSKRSFPKFDGYNLIPRPQSWFLNTEKENLIIKTESKFLSKKMRPEAVLAEQIKFNNALDLDDIYFDDLDLDLFNLACKTYGVVNNKYSKLIQESITETANNLNCISIY